jgi:hypothetical protein
MCCYVEAEGAAIISDPRDELHGRHASDPAGHVVGLRIGIGLPIYVGPGPYYYGSPYHG